MSRGRQSCLGTHGGREGDAAAGVLGQEAVGGRRLRPLPLLLSLLFLRGGREKPDAEISTWLPARRRRRVPTHRPVGPVVALLAIVVVVGLEVHLAVGVEVQRDDGLGEEVAATRLGLREFAHRRSLFRLGGRRPRNLEPRPLVDGTAVDEEGDGGHHPGR